MSVTLAKPCNLLHAALSASLPQSLGTCTGLLGWADRLIVTTWRQWEGLMRNICFCVSTEPLIVQGKGYSTPIQTRHNENPSPRWASWAYNIHPFLFSLPFFFPPLFLTLILRAFILLIVLMLHVFLSRRLKNNRVQRRKKKLGAVKRAAEWHKANVKAAEISQRGCLKLYVNTSSFTLNLIYTLRNSLGAIYGKKNTLPLSSKRHFSSALGTVIV